MNWITNHWEAISLGLYLAINILNAASRHWTNQEGAMRWLTFVTEVLSIIRSRDQAPGSILGNAKLPLDLPKSGARSLIPFAVACAACVAFSACCTSGTPIQRARCWLTRCEAGLEAADPLVVLAIEQACRPSVAKCAAPVDQCPAYKRCKAVALAYQVFRGTAGQGLVSTNAALLQLETPVPVEVKP